MSETRIFRVLKCLKDARTAPQVNLTNVTTIRIESTTPTTAKPTPPSCQRVRGLLTDTLMNRYLRPNMLKYTLD